MEATTPSPALPLSRAVPVRLALAATGLWALVIVAGWAWGSHLNDLGRPILLDAPPLFGEWDLRLNLRILLPVALAAAVIAIGPRLTAELSFRRLLGVTGLAAFAWALALAAIDGAGGVVDPLTTPPEYLGVIPGIESAGSFLSTFTERIDTYPTHVRSHPPGMVLTLLGLDRIGLGGNEAASLLIVAAAATAPLAVLLTLRELVSVDRARRAAPFLVLVPGAVWIATSADALFMAVGAWAVTAIVLASLSDGRRADLLAAAGGILWGVAAMLSYGLVLLALIPALVLWNRRRLRPAIFAGGGFVAVLLVALAAGFNWIDGFFAIREQYLDSVARSRPYEYFVLNNLAAFGLAAGPAVAVALTRSRPSGEWLLVGGALAAVALADLSGMSKAEVERIWLPFLPWLLVATAALPGRAVKPLLIAQVGLALTIQTAVLTPW